MSGLIEFVCKIAAGRAVVGPRITIFKAAWALCETEHATPHDWNRIVPASPGFTHGARPLPETL
jgi:hypothetical protein